jgi:hypothetical protein
VLTESLTLPAMPRFALRARPAWYLAEAPKVTNTVGVSEAEAALAQAAPAG